MLRTLRPLLWVAPFALAASFAATDAAGAVIVTTERDTGDAREPNWFEFDTIPTNSATDAANGKVPMIIGGLQGASQAANLTNGPAQSMEMGAAAESTITADGADGRYIIDLGTVANVAQFNSYSWHPGNRAPQHYILYATTAYEALPGADPTLDGWTSLAVVNTLGLGEGGQHGVSITDSSGSLGSYRYFLMDIEPSATGGNSHVRTNYGEVDIVLVPEPASLSLVGLALGVLASRRRR